MYSEIGPDSCKLIFRRNYFLVSITTEQTDTDFDNIIERINQYMENVILNASITDVIVFSLGWHRTFWSAVYAYDKVADRISKLLFRDRISTRHDRPYNPLYINIYWDSEIGDSKFRNQAKRRNRKSFIENSRKMFMDDYVSFESTFDIFFTILSGYDKARETSIISEELEDLADKNLSKIWLFRPRYGNNSYPDLITALWECYYNSEEIDDVYESNEIPQSFLGGQKAIKFMLEFLINVVPQKIIFLLVLFLLYLYGGLQIFTNIFNDIIIPQFLVYLAQPWYLVLIIIPVLLLIYISTEIMFSKVKFLNRSTPSKLFQFALFYLCLPFALLLGGWLIFIYLFSQISPFEKFNEKNVNMMKFNRRTDSGRSSSLLIKIAKFMTNIKPSYSLPYLASIPSRVIDFFYPSHNNKKSISNEWNSLLSFWEMQRKAVTIGKQTATFIENLYKNIDSLSDAKLQLIGHSFGALVMSNTAKCLSDEQKNPKISINCLCLLQGALSSDWFINETNTIANIKETLVCIYSQYDVANKIYFPFAFHGKYSAGYAGLCGIDGIIKLSANESLYKPFYLNLPPDSPKKRIINYDASCIISQGKYILGGSHNDIFSDQVIYVIWSTIIATSFIF